MSLREAADALNDGLVVVVPTDTVYGVAARLVDPGAVAQLFSVKSRPPDVALPVLVSSLAQVASLGVDWSDDAQRLAERFWPGALTIIVGADPEVATRVGATDTLGLRWARHDVTQSLIDECGPLAVTSANEHGRPPCTSADEVLATRWAAPVEGVLDAGRCEGVVSSVVELTGRGWRLRRAGAVGEAEVASILGPESST